MNALESLCNSNVFPLEKLLLAIPFNFFFSFYIGMVTLNEWCEKMSSGNGVNTFYYQLNIKQNSKSF